MYNNPADRTAIRKVVCHYLPHYIRLPLDRCVSMITQKYLKECLQYDSETGLFLWNLDRPKRHFKDSRSHLAWKNNCSGKPAGGRDSKGYIIIGISIEGFKAHRAHRLAWLYVYGEWPKKAMDHINGLKSDNRISNLRLVSHRENSMNISIGSKNTSGAIGVSWHSIGKKWRAHIKINGVYKHLGLLSDFEEALKARKEAEKEFGFHPNHGREKCQN